MAARAKMLQFAPILTPPTLPNLRLSSKALPFGPTVPTLRATLTSLPVFHM